VASLNNPGSFTVVKKESQLVGIIVVEFSCKCRHINWNGKQLILSYMTKTDVIKTVLRDW
jgi:hypothetical protein